MKRTGTVIILLFILILFVGSMYYLYQKNHKDPTVYETETPTRGDIIEQTIATGNIKPREEILIKPNINGIVDTIFVEAGDIVQTGDLLAKLRVVPQVENLASSKNAITDAKITLDNQEKVFHRQKALFEKGVISANDFDDAQMRYDQAKQNYASAQETYEIIKTGSTKSLGTTTNTNIRATISGMVLDVPIEIGNQVMEASNFNEGTTIASLANVNNMIFLGKIDESEVGKIQSGLPLKITVGAIENKTFDATLYYIAPKADDNEDTGDGSVVQFEIKGRLQNQDSTFIRSGLSANAAIILDQAKDVLTLKESLIQFDSQTNTPFVEVKTGPQEFERRDVKLGLSDGIRVEIKEGLSEEDAVKVWNPIVRKFNN